MLTTSYKCMPCIRKIGLLTFVKLYTTRVYSLFYNLYIRVDTRMSHTHPTGVSCCLTE